MPPFYYVQSKNKVCLICSLIIIIQLILGVLKYLKIFSLATSRKTKKCQEIFHERQAAVKAMVPIKDSACHTVKYFHQESCRMWTVVQQLSIQQKLQEFLGRTGKII